MGNTESRHRVLSCLDFYQQMETHIKDYTVQLHTAWEPSTMGGPGLLEYLSRDTIYHTEEIILKSDVIVGLSHSMSSAEPA